MATVAELNELIDNENLTRDESNQIVPDGARKKDLEKALADAGVEVESDGEMLYVTAPIVGVTTKNRTVKHLYRGDVISPNDIAPESLENLKQLGFVSTDAP